MKFDWDPAKAESNVRKHGVRFAEAVTVLEDEAALTMLDPSWQGEERWITLGVDSLRRAMVVVYTWRGDAIRIISARKATPRERRQYGERR